jgi:MFS family permease
MITYGIGQTVLFIVFPPLVEQIGLSLTQFGLIFAASNLILAMMAIYWGRMSDRVGRKPMLMFGLFGYALGTTLVTLCLEWGVRGSPAPWVLFGALLLSRLVYSSMASAINPTATAYIADTTNRSQRSQGMALIGMTAGIGTMLGPVIGGGFAFISVLAPMYVAIGLSLLALILIGAMLKEPAKHQTSEHEVAKKLSWLDPRIRGFLIMTFSFWMGFTMIQVIIAFYIEKQIGIEGSQNVAQATASAFFCLAIWALLMQTVVIQRFKISTRMMLRSGLPAFVAGLLVLLLGSGMWSVWVAFSFFGMSMGLSNAGISGGASLSVEAHEQGALGGLLSAAPILGMVLGPLLGPFMFEQLSPTFPMKAGLVVFSVLSVFALTLKVPER